MGLKTLLARRAVRAAHVLIVETPGWQRARMATEQAVSARGWRMADAPAEADVLVVCGPPGPELRDVLDLVWDQLPGPRARVSAAREGAVDAALGEAAQILLDEPFQRADAGGRFVDAPTGGGTAHGSGSDGGDGGMEHGGMGHGGMGHGGMDMAPGGIALAEGAPDPDGLDLDVLHVPIGPVLSHWPAGLVLECTMQGDRVAEVHARLLDDDAAHNDAGAAHEEVPVGLDGAGRGEAARCCDDAARLLAVAGWDSAAAAARRTRGALLAGAPAARCMVDLERLGTRVRRSVVLHWSLRGLTVPDPDGGSSDLSTVPGRSLAAARAALGADMPPTKTQAISPGLVAQHVRGLDLASVRLVVAGVGNAIGGGSGAVDG